MKSESLWGHASNHAFRLDIEEYGLMEQQEPRAILQNLLKQVIRARLTCNTLRQQEKEVFGQSQIDILPETQQQARLDKMVNDAPMPPDLSDVPPEKMREVALQFVTEGLQFLTKHSDVINSAENEASKQLREIEEQLDKLSADIFALMEKMP